MATRWVAMDFGGPEVLLQQTVELPAPEPGEVTIEVRAAGMNPADYKHIAPGQQRSLLPLTLGFEAAGVVAAVGETVDGASGYHAIGDEVVAFQILGGYASALNVNTADVFAKPANLGWAEAGNLLLVGTTAAEMLHVSNVREADVVLVHGAAGAVGTSVLQQARLLGAHVIGTASESNFDVVEGYGATPVAYGEGLEQRVREVAPDGVVAALDTAGTDEAIDVSLALVADRGRIVTIVNQKRATQEGIVWIGGSNPASGPYRASQRARLLELAGGGSLEVLIGATYPLDDAKTAMAALMGQHPAGKFALVA